MPLPEHLSEDAKKANLLQSMYGYFTQTMEGPLISARFVVVVQGLLRVDFSLKCLFFLALRCQGVWISPENKQSLVMCQRALTGHRWECLTFPGISPATRWTIVCASRLPSVFGKMHSLTVRFLSLQLAHALFNYAGCVWAQQPNGSIFVFDPDRSAKHLKMFEIDSPAPHSAQGALSLCVGGAFVWILMPSGRVYVRGGIYENCPQGIKWSNLDLMQLGPSKFMSYLTNQKYS